MVGGTGPAAFELLFTVFHTASPASLHVSPEPSFTYLHISHIYL